MKYVIIGIVVLALAVPAGLYFTGTPPFAAREVADEAETPKVDASLPPTYMPLEPPFVVNFTHRGTLRYLQVSLEVTYKDIALLEKVGERMPQIRNDLILLFSGQDYEHLSSLEGKEKLRGEIMAAINHVIGIETPAAVPVPVETGSGPAVTAAGIAAAQASPGEVYITNFVMQ